MNDFDMTPTIAARSDQMNADDLIGGPQTFTVAEVRVHRNDEQPVDIVLAEYDPKKPFKPSKTVRRILVSAWGKDSREYVGRRMTLYRDPSIKFGGQAVGGIRVSHLSHIDKPLTIALTETRGKRGISKILPLTDPTAPPTQQRHQPTPEQVLESTDLDQLRAWWLAGDADTRELIDTRVLVLKETEGQVSES